MIAACGPLKLEYGGNQWWRRWGPAFQRLHLLCCYQTVSKDNTAEGRKYATYLLNGRTVRQAWMQTGIEVQPSSVWIAVMGVASRDGYSSWNDHSGATAR